MIMRLEYDLWSKVLTISNKNIIKIIKNIQLFSAALNETYNRSNTENHKITKNTPHILAIFYIVKFYQAIHIYSYTSKVMEI